MTKTSNSPSQSKKIKVGQNLAPKFVKCKKCGEWILEEGVKEHGKLVNNKYVVCSKS